MFIYVQYLCIMYVSIYTYIEYIYIYIYIFNIIYIYIILYIYLYVLIGLGGGSWCNDALPFGGRSLALRRSKLCNLNCQVIVNWIAQCTSFFHTARCSR